MPSTMVIGTGIMRGTIPTGGTTITPDGSGGIILNGPNGMEIGAAPTAIGTIIMRGTTAIGGTNIIRNGSNTIIMNGRDGMMTTDETTADE